ncbi:MAG: hypothetical protein A2900_00410 [Candidatus Chisholmbacteria bacterium RIFCSPLOWO2_01_FULL_50_28]|uniref:Uncharacterized protein n=1 Tax=Candidatus Chisholmbacteria bacterium RIFCSPHIGHO2_01_FULL_52_32 TaxID=1797591 RepID=A0A1G1VR13_9BACT|nr:MAG: hypothetical protein A2786_00755 [Candidatus Chisholmbacteria bacterium RIFCSPHIGHO2_01_FULL_52_32]OGY19567.1 MAG: hypothetical protein A2900_00410 [Candidatus Chisholmbacteria bacterium RIFCSPLOWO2_01_FULL_50_28]
MIRGAEFFVYRTGSEAVELKARFDRAESLYGSPAMIERDGTILVPKWMPVLRGTVSPDEYTALSKSRYSDEALFRQGLITKDVRVMQIHEVQKNGGSVETGIRMVTHILEEQRETEREQVEVVLGRSRYLLSLFSEHEISGIPRAKREALQEETVTQLSEAGLDPARVLLEIKLLMALWLIKASKGEDSWGRPNELVTLQGLFAVERRAKQREEEVGGYITAKYAQIEAALTFARASDRMILVDVGEEIEQHLLRNIYLTNAGAPARRDYGYTIGKIGSLAWLLDQTKVRPYRTVALDGKQRLEAVQHLLKEGRREEIFASDLLSGLTESAQVFQDTLSAHADVYSEDS